MEEKRYQEDKSIRCTQHIIGVENGKNCEEYSQKNKGEGKNSKNRRNDHLS